MVYVNADGTVGDGTRPRTKNPFKIIASILTGILDIAVLFVRSVTNPPDRLTDVSVAKVFCLPLPRLGFFVSEPSLLASPPLASLRRRLDGLPHQVIAKRQF